MPSYTVRKQNLAPISSTGAIVDVQLVAGERIVAVVNDSSSGIVVHSVVQEPRPTEPDTQKLAFIPSNLASIPYHNVPPNYVLDQCYGVVKGTFGELVCFRLVN